MSVGSRRQTLARHGQLSSPRPFAQVLKFLGVALSVVLVSSIAVVGFVVADLYGTATADAVELDGGATVANISEFEGGFDLLLAGLDTCEEEYAELFGDRCTGADADGNLNDVNILVHVSEEPRRVTAVSFPRDLMVTIPECVDAEGNETDAIDHIQINQAYSIGGLNCVARAITELTGQNIEFASSVTFGGVIEITNAIGGVEVCLANPIKDRNTGLDMEAGTHTVEGLQALQFLRTRYGVGDSSDLARIGNQQQYLSSLVRKVSSGEVLGNVPVMLRLANTALSNLEASRELTNPSTIVQIGLAVKDVPFEDIVFVQYPAYDDPADRNRLLPDEEAGEVLWDAILANKQLEITHEATGSDGVVVEGGDEGTDAGETAQPGDTPEPTESATPTPDPSIVELPGNIRGNSAAQQTCSNGNVR